MAELLHRLLDRAEQSPLKSARRARRSGACFRSTAVRWARRCERLRLRTAHRRMSQMCPCAFSRAPSCAMNGTCARGAHACAYAPRRNCARQAAAAQQYSEHLPRDVRKREGRCLDRARHRRRHHQLDVRLPGHRLQRPRLPQRTAVARPWSDLRCFAAPVSPARAHAARGHRAQACASSSAGACFRPASVSGGSRYSGWSYGLKPASPASAAQRLAASRVHTSRRDRAGRIASALAPLCAVFTPSSLHVSARWLWKPWPCRMKWTCGSARAARIRATSCRAHH